MAAGLRLDPLGELKRSPRPSSRRLGLGPPGGRGGRRREGKKGKGEVREGKVRVEEVGEGGEGRRDGKRREGRGEGRGREGVHNLRKTTPRHQMACYGSELSRTSTNGVSGEIVVRDASRNTDPPTTRPRSVEPTALTG